jgi:hypothetical protein
MSQTAARASPYPGPTAFSETEEQFFCGRKRETAELCDLLSAQRIGVLYSGSGAGKTSLVRAGLKPRFENQKATVRVLRVGFRPDRGAGKDSAGNVFVANAVSSASPNSGWTSDAHLSALVEPVSEHAQVLVFDQFEEIFTTFLDRWQDRGEFFGEVAKLLRIPSVHVLFCLREEYLASLGGYEGFLPDGFRLRYHLERLRAGQALDAIKVPAKTAGCPFEDAIAENLVEDLCKERVQTERGLKTVVGEFVEPLQLQVVCAQIWKTLPSGAKTITAEHVRRFGNADAALGDYFETAVRQIAASGKAGEERLRAWFEKDLITAGGTRGIVYRGRRFTNGIRNEVVDQLEATHLIRGEARAGSMWYELTHDRFIDPIKESNRAWRREKGIQSNAAAWIGTPISSAILIAVTGILLYALVALWPARDGAAPTLFGFSLPAAFETRLLYLVAVAGAIGSFLNAVGRLAQYLVTRSFKASWIWLYFARVPLDAGLAVMCYCALRAFLAPALPGKEVPNSFGICGFGALVGFFGGPMIEKLRDAADDVFRTAPGMGDDARSDGLSQPQPAIFESSPAELLATTESVWITLRGSSLVPGTTALIAGQARRTAYVDETELRVLLGPGDTSTGDTISIEAELPPPGKARSNAIAIPVVRHTG